MTCQADKRAGLGGAVSLSCPTSLVEYVVAHELVHLLHPDHTREFWQALGRVMPDYDDRRGRLRDVGVRLGW